MRRIVFLVALIAAALVGDNAAAAAKSWTVSKDASELEIYFTIDGKERRGFFAAYSGEARFDPDDLENAEMILDISTGSLDAGHAFATEVVKGEDWLASDAHPEARYELISLTPRPDGGYVAEGRLTMRGETRVVTGELEIGLVDDLAIAKGVVTFDREQFGIGVGFTALFVDVGATIAVAFDLKATPDI
ncbi:MAG: YceI family protein [Pseudomonadota bacterium]